MESIYRGCNVIRFSYLIILFVTKISKRHHVEVGIESKIARKGIGTVGEQRSRSGVCDQLLFETKSVKPSHVIGIEFSLFVQICTL